MNYINRLELEKETLLREKLEGQIAMSKLIAYLLSSKFHKDTTVQVKDVLTRLDPIRLSLL